MKCFSRTLCWTNCRTQVQRDGVIEVFTPSSERRASLFSQAHRSGLTLIETILVLGVVALLGAIIFALLSPVRERTRQAVCASHLHQLGQALALYHADSGMGGCQSAYGFPLSIGRLYPRYVSTPELFRCPNDVSGHPFSYVYQVWRDTDPVYVPITGLTYSAPNWCQLFARRGDNYPLVVDPHHATPQQRQFGPRLWFVLRVDGQVERVLSGPAIPSWGL